jgi:hypothetical protein
MHTSAMHMRATWGGRGIVERELLIDSWSAP